ncbi:uncharacterized protein BXZ73DRAFT_101509 [Epithele typhae]|uniref:uncharacterized protein n=1 Tax=Epithele typhae TaxID=378194 RepID=UPI002007F5DA|nr:uncharacterized protein BXZ73DRAFT_101509 [Epithele typhae]KAH9932135.1 hypothetical protein BXZ73DRAFT_101509 [Epithele typhae]
MRLFFVILVAIHSFSTSHFSSRLELFQFSNEHHIVIVAAIGFLASTGILSGFLRLCGAAMFLMLPTNLSTARKAALSTHDMFPTTPSSLISHTPKRPDLSDVKGK